MFTDLIIFCASYLFIVVLLIAGVFFWKQQKSTKQHLLIFALVSFSITFVLAFIGGHLFYDTRPFITGHFTPLIPHSADNGFPSDHTLLTSAVAFLIYVFNKKLGIALFVLSIIVGMARVYAGIHSPIDIVGSIFISMIATGIAFTIMHKNTRFQSSR
jgi:undecaprenyl-diphosphatase